MPPSDHDLPLGLLHDEALVKLIKEGALGNVVLPRDPFEKDSVVQPASLDLTIGGVYLPGAKEGELGSVDHPCESYEIQPGESVIAQTKEILCLPSNIAGIGFAPTTLGAQGLTVPTVGHIDPGWNGPLSITLINMGRRPVLLHEGDPIATILLFKLHKGALRPYDIRKRSDPKKKLKRSLAALSIDFGSFQEMAARIAHEEARKELEKLAKSKRHWLEVGVVAAGITILVTAAVGLLMYFLQYLISDRDRVVALEARVETLQKQRTSMPALIPRSPHTEGKAAAGGKGVPIPPSSSK